MVGWQRNCIQSLTRHFGKASLSETQHSLLRRPFYLYSQHSGISSSRKLLEESSSDVSTPKTQTPPAPSLKQVQYVLKGVTQDPNKIDLVGKLVRGMRVEDVLSQLSMTDKQAAKTMYQAIFSARADATYKHGLDPNRLLVAGASIGKGFVGFSKKRLAYHGNGNGIKVRPKHQLTVVLREIAPEEEAQIEGQRADNFLYLSKRLRLTKEENQHVPPGLLRKNKDKYCNALPSDMEDKETLIKHEEQDPAEPETEEYREEFQCCVCLELLYKPVVLGCGHISCFWCVFNCMNACQESNCPVCRHQYNHFPSICDLLHFILQKLYPKAYQIREKQVGEEEKKAGYFSPQVQSSLGGPDPTESDIPGNVAHSPPFPESKNSKGCSSRVGESPSLVNSPEVLDHEANIASLPTSSKNVKPTENAAVQEHCFHGNDLENGTHKEISVSDLLCAACKNLLFQPVVLNCGHVYCESCISIPEDGISRCEICQSMHPNGFPSVCLVLEHFLEEQYPEAHAQRRASSLKQADSQLNVRQRAKQSSSTLSDEYLSCIYGNGPKVHFGIGCDYCGMSPIIGERYRCKDCVERMGFDLCGACYRTPAKIPGRFNQQHKPEHQLENVQPEMKDFLTYQLDEDDSEVLEQLGNAPPVPHTQEPENDSNNVQNDSAAFVLSVDTSRDPDDDFNDCLPDLTQE